ncbi:MAG TPA: substrate-binding domain-containing protein [Bosea sp. (in: a-proteobacteria)]|jgi:molybdate transport system substrate-binding protein|uniref:substrate-binding domain-containing protein n=1 Tax=Bosea sp. (in: a-proteobacteria) TaxID=1871050 RepID=UPI002E14E771|nr:substrate-binding domain-containing protein [Bosea sp. (in: a-proteobacteria)]
MTDTGKSDRPIRFHAAGSLRSAVQQILLTLPAGYNSQVEATFGPAGLLRQQIEDGEPSDVFASANMRHPERLHRLGLFEAPTCFARNRICAIARTDLGLTTTNLLEALLDDHVRIGTSTPGADPSGDYALEVFDKINGLRPGAGAVLGTKARHLVGGPQPLALPPGRFPAEWLIETGQADVFLGYWSSALPLRDDARLSIVDLPAECMVTADYGIAVSVTASSAARQLVKFMFSDSAQQILEHQGFQRVSLDMRTSADPSQKA